jgi:1-acyl-sn-glycerol-3-phosphate acyltransferase
MLLPTWPRRLLVAPLVLAAAASSLLLSPLVLLVLLAIAPWLPGKWRPLRFTWFVLLYCWVDALELIALFLLWVATGFGLAIRSPWSQRVHYALLGGALKVLESEARRVLRVRIVNDGATPDDVHGRPLVVLARHAGAGDSFLLVHLLANRYQREPRIVLKALLQWDPALDVLLNRLPTHFVGGGTTRPQVELVADLATGLDDNDAFVIFPEGGNFTVHRRRRSIDFLREHGFDDKADAAERMSNVLAPRVSGTVAALTTAREADVLVVAHTGLEHLNSVKAFWRYLPMDTEIRVHWWQIPDAEVPRDPVGIASWLFGWWRIVDDWVEAHEPDVVKVAQADPTTRTEPRVA